MRNKKGNNKFSLNNILSQKISSVVTIKDLYSASVVLDLEITICFFALLDTRQLPKNISNAVVDLQSLEHLAECE
jgi:predicted PurR-regulated permease PerM